MEKNYNSNRDKLLLPEYGRNILQMIESLKKIEDRGKRNDLSRVIIDVMGNINPTLRDSQDYKHKLWDHLFIIAECDLDIDSPYPIIDKNALAIKPGRISYPGNRFTHKQYGNNIRLVIKKLTKIKDSEMRNNAMADIAKFMKFKSYEYNKEFPSDDVILNDIRKFTDNEIDVNEEMLTGAKIAYNRNTRSVKKGARPNQKQQGTSRQVNYKNTKRR